MIARVLRHLGLLQMQQHRLAKAEQSLQRALEGESVYNSPASPYAAEDLQTLGEIEAADGKQADAERNMRKALSIYRTTAQVNLRGRADTLEGLGTLLLKEHRNVEAKPILTEAVAILQKGLPATAPSLRRAESQLSKISRAIIVISRNKGPPSSA